MALDFSLHFESLRFASIDSTKGAVAPYGDLVGPMGPNLKELLIDSLTTCFDIVKHNNSPSLISYSCMSASVLTDRAARHMLGSCHYMTNGLTTER
jgi:hypothetical protein